MKERIAKLLCVKSIVTLILTAVFSYLSVIGQIGSDQFMTVFTVVVAFYFGTQYEKKVAQPANVAELREAEADV